MGWLAIALFGVIRSHAYADAYTVTEQGIATVFGYPGDKLGRGRTRCLYDVHGRRRPVDPERDIGIAHRELDCGAVVYVTNLETGLTLQAVVVDAGPWGALTTHPSGKRVWYVKRSPWHRPGRDVCPSQRCKPGKWRGIADLTPRAAKLLGHDGWARVRLVYDKRDLRWYKALQRARQRQLDRRNQT